MIRSISFAFSANNKSQGNMMGERPEDEGSYITISKDVKKTGVQHHDDTWQKYEC